MREVKFDLGVLRDVQEEMCEEYCRFGKELDEQGADQEELEMHCMECPLNNILEHESPYCYCK